MGQHRPGGRQAPLGPGEGRGQQLRCCWPLTGPPALCWFMHMWPANPSRR
eukprot:NODE_3851_length_872_cov_7.460510_g3199_i0.p10 GENE.NODE_3851_length_872_cov_7.460510_g3199_i0~~NODE_3851_length_872_cov_7.460510_g3199_i0.p10  ORF type:complete len:50 (-),score=0.78 NODE_3851_length_872_cov_7.460510_g3199_i0:116-265(-)